MNITVAIRTTATATPIDIHNVNDAYVDEDDTLMVRVGDSTMSFPTWKTYEVTRNG